MADELAERFAALASAADDSDWSEVEQLASPRRGRRAWLVVAAAVASGVVAFATPAFGLRAMLVRAFGDAEPAPASVQRSFASLDVDAPPGLASRVSAMEARKLVMPRGGALWIAPTAGGGFCWFAIDAAGRCDQEGTDRFAPVFSITGNIARDGTIRSGPVRIDGSTTAEGSASVEIHFADGDVATVEVVRVGTPIDAAFFTYNVPRAHWADDRRPTLLVLRDAAGKELSRSSSVFDAPSFRKGPSTGVAECVVIGEGRPCLGDGRADRRADTRSDPQRVP